MGHKNDTRNFGAIKNFGALKNDTENFGVPMTILLKTKAAPLLGKIAAPTHKSGHHAPQCKKACQ